MRLVHFLNGSTEQEKCFLMKKNEEMAVKSGLVKDVEMLLAPPSV